MAARKCVVSGARVSALSSKPRRPMMLDPVLNVEGAFTEVARIV